VFELANEKIAKGILCGAIIFIDKLDAIGTKHFSENQSKDREVQHTMLGELLSQLDGFSSNNMIKVIAATNRPDILDPALLLSGCLYHKIELPHPPEDVHMEILCIHSCKMNLWSTMAAAEKLAATAGWR
jgi:26S proteasome regulatory subunit T5